MEHHTTTILLRLCTALLLIALSGAGEECIGQGGMREPVLCYECLSYSSVNNFCADPFNKTLNKVPLMECNGYCVKWVREVRTGVMRYQRTCSKNLNIQMSISLVCIEEARPRSGVLCFCNKSKCNSGNFISISRTLTAIVYLLPLVITYLGLLI